MTQNPYDQLSKQLLEELLTPLGTVQRSLEIPGEAKFVDLWFQPDHEAPVESGEMDLLKRMARTSCLLEPYRNPPSRFEIRSCLLKLLWVREELRRKAVQQRQSLTEQDLPLLWIIATSVSQPVVQAFGAVLQSEWGSGLYFLAEGLGTILISIEQLPVERQTLVLRVLGRGETQQTAIAEVLALPPEDPLRPQLLRILGNWKVTLELSQVEFEERESLMAFSQAFLEWEQATERKGLEQGLERGLERGLEHERSLILRLLTRKVGTLSPGDTARVRSLPIEKLEALGEALLEFDQPANLHAWLQQHSA